MTDQLKETAKRLFQMCLEVHQFCKKHPDCILVESWEQLMPSIKENYLKDARQIAQLIEQCEKGLDKPHAAIEARLIPQGDDEGLLTPEEMWAVACKHQKQVSETGEVGQLCKDIAKAQRDLTRQEIPEAVKAERGGGLENM